MLTTNIAFSTVYCSWL